MEELKALKENERLYAIFSVVEPDRPSNDRTAPVVHRWKTEEDIDWDLTEIEEGVFYEDYTVAKSAAALKVI